MADARLHKDAYAMNIGPSEKSKSWRCSVFGCPFKGTKAEVNAHIKEKKAARQ